MNLYRKNFQFKASSYDVTVVGGSRQSGISNVTITAEILSNDSIHFILEGNYPDSIASFFVLPILEPYEGGDILPDRIMYGRLPRFEGNVRPLLPVVCEIFNNMTTIRFALLNPLRIIEFYGNFIE